MCLAVRLARSVQLTRSDQLFRRARPNQLSRLVRPIQPVRRARPGSANAGFYSEMTADASRGVSLVNPGTLAYARNIFRRFSSRIFSQSVCSHN